MDSEPEKIKEFMMEIKETCLKKKFKSYFILLHISMMHFVKTNISFVMHRKIITSANILGRDKKSVFNLVGVNSVCESQFIPVVTSTVALGHSDTLEIGRK